uniref:Coactosin-like protein n=1 Tax=Oryctolagus cuniculus TaxID=9986 RepID=G1T823_RABIT
MAGGGGASAAQVPARSRSAVGAVAALGARIPASPPACPPRRVPAALGLLRPRGARSVAPAGPAPRRRSHGHQDRQGGLPRGVQPGARRRLGGHLVRRPPVRAPRPRGRAALGRLTRVSLASRRRVTFRYDGCTIVPGEQGAEYERFVQQCTDDVRLFAFVRFTTGDAMSKRSKFALITWIGENVSGLQRAKTGTDKTLVKEVVQNFAKEFVISDRKELEEEFIRSELKKAGGANYDAQAE